MRASIEIAHVEITPGGAFSETQVERSIHVGARVKEVLADLDVDAHFLVLADDKKLAKHERAEGVRKLLAFVTQRVEVAGYCAEHQLVGYLDRFLRTIESDSAERRIGENLKDQLARNGGFLPCAADISIWHSLRLGLFADSKNLVHKVSADFVPADIAVSVLSEDLREAEETAVAKYLKHVSRTHDRIERIYFPASPDRAWNEQELKLNTVMSNLTQEAQVS